MIMQPLLLAAVLLELCVAAPSAHHSWLPLSEWGQSEPALPTWDYFGLGSPYPLQPRVDAHESWFPQPVANPPTIEIVRTFRKPTVDPSAWARIPVIGGDRDSSRHWVALVPRGFEDFVLVRKPFVIVEETDSPAKDNKTEPKEKKGSKDDDSKDDSKDTSKDDSKTTDRAGEPMKTPEPTSSTNRPTTNVRSTSPTTTTTTTSSTSTTPSTPVADDAENAAAAGDNTQSQQSKN